MDWSGEFSIRDLSYALYLDEVMFEKTSYFNYRDCIIKILVCEFALTVPVIFY